MFVKHIADPRFGIYLPGNLTFHDYLSQILTDISKLKGIDAQIVLRQFYETKFGIFDHILNGNQRPLSTVALYDAEENGPSSLLYSRIESYMRSEVYKHTGLNLVEFLNLPREIVQLIFRITENKTHTEGQALSEVQQQLKAMSAKDKSKK